jgi:uncharacterized protein YecT (DUF1311 family)
MRTARRTTSNIEFKACLARAADKADQKLNQAYKALQAAIRAAGKEMDQSSDPQIASLTGSQKKWIAIATTAAPSRIASHSAERRRAATTRAVFAR